MSFSPGVRQAVVTIPPSMECVDEKGLAVEATGTRGMALIGPPVWRSQLLSIPSPNCTKKWPSGEKLVSRGTCSSWGSSRVVSLSRVTASRISIVPGFASAMNLLHGDHTAPAEKSSWYMVATIGSHEIGNPCTILTNGRAYCSYSLRTIEVWGDRGSAE